MPPISPRLTPIAGHPRYHFVQGRHLRPRRRRREPSRQFQPDAVMHLAAESHVDRSIDGLAAFIETNIVGTYALLEAALRLLARACQPGRRRLPLPSRLDRRGLRLARARAASSPKTRPTTPNSPYSACKAAVRSSGARLAPHLWAAGRRHQLLQQLRALPVSRKADPAHHPQCARGQAAAGLRRPARMCATGSMSRIMRARCCSGPEARPVGETYNVGGTQRADQSRRGRADLRHSMIERPPRGAPHRATDHLRRRPARPRPPLRHRCDARSSASSAGSRGRPSRAASTRPCAGISTTAAWWEPLRADIYPGERLGLLEPASRQENWNHLI